MSFQARCGVWSQVRWERGKELGWGVGEACWGLATSGSSTEGRPSFHPFHRRAESLREERGGVSRPRPSQEAMASFGQTRTVLVKSKSFPYPGGAPPYSIWWNERPWGGVGGHGEHSESRCGPTAAPGWPGQAHWTPDLPSTGSLGTGTCKDGQRSPPQLESPICYSPGNHVFLENDVFLGWEWAATGEFPPWARASWGGRATPQAHPEESRTGAQACSPEWSLLHTPKNVICWRHSSRLYIVTLLI